MANDTCSVDGCEKAAKSRGWCIPHYKKWYKHGDPEYVRPPTRAEWLKARCAQPFGTECVEWPHCKDAHGYGRIGWQGETTRVHKLAWTFVNGEVPQGMHLLHLPVVCHNPSCFNPNHLRLGTHAENVRDRVADGTSNRGERSGTSVLSENDVLIIRDDERSARIIAKEFGISRGHVTAIRRRERWSHIPE